MPALPGVSHWVHRLHEQGWLQAIASAAPRPNIEVLLEALGLTVFKASCLRKMCHRGKPDPEVYLAAASWVGVMPSRCIVVEDAAAGIEGARAAGMRSIGVEHRGQHLAADVAVKSLDLLEAFRQAALRQLAGVDPGSRTDGAAATKRRSIGARRHTTCLRGSRSTRRSRPGWARRCRRSASTRVAFLPAGRRSRVPNRS